MLTTEQRLATLEDCITMAVDAGGKRLRCACPGIVQAWNSTAQTVSVKLAIKEVLSIEGVETETEIPMLVDVPVVMPRAGGYCLLMVPQPGDECLVVFSDLCIDAWYQSGGIQSQAERRRHDLSDGFAIMGCWSQVRKPTFPSEGIALQNDAGTDIISIDSEGVHISGGASVKDIDSNDYGVAIGMDTTATEEAKKFEVASDHTSYLYGATQISNLTYLNGKQYDSDWVDLTSYIDTTLFTPTADYMMARRLGDVVNMRFAGEIVSNMSFPRWQTISTAIPEQFRPLYPMECLLLGSGTTSGTTKIYDPGWLRVDTDGTMQIYRRTGSATAGWWLSGSTTYMVGGTPIPSA